jgi:hypothetical protein
MAVLFRHSQYLEVFSLYKYVNKYWKLTRSGWGSTSFLLDILYGKEIDLLYQQHRLGYTKAACGPEEHSPA